MRRKAVFNLVQILFGKACKEDGEQFHGLLRRQFDFAPDRIAVHKV